MTGTAATAAMSQAIMEASLPIAQQDAQFFQTATMQNLDNRQQMAVQKAQVLSNLQLANLDARMTAAVNNSKSFLQMDLANLDNAQQAEIVNTQARVQSILEDSKAENAARLFRAESQNDFTKFYDQLSSQIDMFNREQRSAMERFNAGEVNDLMKFYDQLSSQTGMFNAEQRNALARFNAGEVNAAREFYDQLSAQTGMFNAEQRNALARFNAGEVNAASEFNARIENQREQFYREMQYNVDLANARWRQTVETANTEMQFEAAKTDVKNIVGLTEEGLNRVWDRADSILDYAWKSSETEKDRELRLITAEMNANATKESAESQGKGALWGGILGLGSKIITEDPFDWW